MSQVIKKKLKLKGICLVAFTERERGGERREREREGGRERERQRQREIKTRKRLKFKYRSFFYVQRTNKVPCANAEKCKLHFTRSLSLLRFYPARIKKQKKKKKKKKKKKSVHVLTCVCWWNLTSQSITLRMFVLSVK